jgi:hypothetical protein
MLPVMPDSSRRSLPVLWLPLACVLLALVFRWLKLESPGMTLLPNFSPWMALAFTGTLLFPRALAWWVWPLLLVGIDIISQGVRILTPAGGGLEALAMYGCYATAAWAAARMRGSASLAKALSGVLTASLAFYLITNSVSWLVEPGYAKSAGGWWQALTTGLPGYAPTWTFLRNSLLSDLGFSALLVVLFNAEAQARTLPRLRWLAPAAA